MRTRIWHLLGLMVISSCATSSNYAVGLQKWVGEPEQMLYQEWGVPSNVYYISPNRKIVTFNHSSQQGTSNPYSNEVDYDVINSGYETDTDYTYYYCNTSFTITNGFVTDYTFSGDNCVSDN